MQIYHFTNGYETYLIEAWNVYSALRRLQDKGVDLGYFALIYIEAEMSSQQTDHRRN